MPERRNLHGAVALTVAWALGCCAAFGGGAVELRPRVEPWNPLETIESASIERGQLFALRTGARLGEIVLHEPWRDFRGQSIAAGRYGLRYALQPRLKDHVGVDSIRDFALLVPSGLDSSDDWIAASRSVSGTAHPAVMALLPWAGDGDPPAEHHDESPERLVLFRSVAATAIGFVVVGRAPEPELL